VEPLRAKEMFDKNGSTGEIWLLLLQKVWLRRSDVCTCDNGKDPGLGGSAVHPPNVDDGRFELRCYRTGDNSY